MAVINTNVKALFSQAALASTGRAQTVAMQQLSTGKRINSARDDAAGMAIATRMTHQIRSLNQAVRNAGDAVSMIQTAEGATNQITDMLQRMRELAIQATNDTNSNDQRSYLDLEFQQLKKQIVQISENTDWNGFPLLNGSAGEIVGPMPVYKATGNGVYESAITHEVTASSKSSGGKMDFSMSSGELSKSGTLSISISVPAGADPVVNSKFVLEDGTAVNLEGTLNAAGDTVTFTNTALTDGKGTFVIQLKDDLDASSPVSTSEDIVIQTGRQFAQVDPIKSGDVTINDESIPPTIAKYDSTSVQDGNHLASSLARAAAINSIYDKTGVRAVVNTNVMTGAAMTGDAVLQGTSTGTVTINGYTSARFTTVENNTRASREAVVKAINAVSELTGVVAKDTGMDDKGITLTAADGRNIELAFNTSSSSADFSARTGLKQGLQIGSYSLESKVETPVVIASNKIGGAERLGLEVGDFSQNVTRVISAAREIVESPVSQVTAIGVDDAAASTYTITVNGKPFTNVTKAAGGTYADYSSVASAINADQESPVRAEVDATDHKLYLYAKVPGVPFTVSIQQSTGAGLTAGDAMTATTVVENVAGSDKPLMTGDLKINGVAIPGAMMDDDMSSNQAAFSSRAGSSSIAIANAINSKSEVTGVTAIVDPPVMIASGAVNSELPATGTYMVYVNGVGVAVDLIKDESPEQRLKAVIKALKAQQGEHGVQASPNGTGGLKLTTVDGRNLSVWIDPTQRSLSTQVQNPATGEMIDVTVPSEVQHITAAMFGLETGSGTPQQTDITFKGSFDVGDTVSFKINNTTISTVVTDAMVPGGTPDFDALASALKSSLAKANITEFSDGTIDPKTYDDGGNGLITLKTDADGNTVLELRSVISAFEVSDFKLTPANPDTSTSDVVFDTVTHGFKIENGKWVMDDKHTILNPKASDIAYIEAEKIDPTLDPDNYNTIEDILKNAPDTRIQAKTLYGGVKLISEKQFTLEAGENGFGTSSNFSALGFTEGTFGGRSSADLSPPRVGRMTFQVGASVGQNITFDLADFGKNGPITQEITWDVDLDPMQPGANVPMPGTVNPIANGKPLTRSFISSRESALEVLAKLDATMDKVNATRATMGAVMNRLDHVITNLTNVSMNLSASRSQIEDADYASASTELAKTQIMQQAATAVLAQANTSQQSVLKLLQGG